VELVENQQMQIETELENSIVMMLYISMKQLSSEAERFAKL